MEELLDKVREQFYSSAYSKSMFESILGRIWREHVLAVSKAYSEGHAAGVGVCEGYVDVEE